MDKYRGTERYENGERISKCHMTWHNETENTFVECAYPRYIYYIQQDKNTLEWLVWGVIGLRKYQGGSKRQITNMYKADCIENGIKLV